MTPPVPVPLLDAEEGFDHRLLMVFFVVGSRVVVVVEGFTRKNDAARDRKVRRPTAITVVVYESGYILHW